jgi:hypothetical protein
MKITYHKNDKKESFNFCSHDTTSFNINNNMKYINQGLCQIKHCFSWELERQKQNTFDFRIRFIQNTKKMESLFNYVLN